MPIASTIHHLEFSKNTIEYKFLDIAAKYSKKYFKAFYFILKIFGNLAKRHTQM